MNRMLTEQLSAVVAMKGGTASVNGSASPLIVFNDAQRSGWFDDPYHCE
jgi:hypothetical protein